MTQEAPQPRQDETLDLEIADWATLTAENKQKLLNMLRAKWMMEEGIVDKLTVVCLTPDMLKHVKPTGRVWVQQLRPPHSIVLGTHYMICTDSPAVIETE